MTRTLRIGWIGVGLAASVAVPFRVAEIVAAHHPGVLFSAGKATDVSTPTFAFSHPIPKQGNLKDE
jgi:hypothetical protein